MKSIIKTNQPEVGHGIAIFDPTIADKNVLAFCDYVMPNYTGAR